MTSEGSTRAARKEKTRRALLDQALDLGTARGFGAVSLREVTRGAGLVPTAFYRHFTSLDDLGLALVTEAARTLRTTVREIERAARPSAAVEILAGHVHQNPSLLGFLARERHGGAPAVRHAIADETTLVVRDVTVTLSRAPQLREWSAEDLDTAAALLVDLLLETVAALDESTDARTTHLVTQRATRQLRLVLLGISGWRPRPD
ncbi:MAG TPA: TetR family transcriptional regulator [Aldersonia sp.]